VPALGPRFLIEAGFIVAVAVVAGVERFRTVTIVIVMAAAVLVVGAVELVFARKRRAGAQPERTPSAEPLPPASKPEVPASPAARILRAEGSLPESTPPPPEPEPLPEEAPAPEPPRPIPQRPRLGAVPPQLPEPEAISAPTPEPVAAVVPLAPRRAEPREWNIWELERLVRAHSGADVARDEERSYLLMYLREFANPEGHLPADFDGVVRETFGDELDAIPY
jgi:hypothetical protein